MTVPTIRGAESIPFTGYALSELYEAALAERGLTSDAGNDQYTQATAQQVAEARRFVVDGIAYLYSVRELWWPMRESDVTAEVQADAKYSLIATPADCGRFEAITVNNVPLKIVTYEEYLANLISASDGGGTLLTDLTGDPSVARVVVAAGGSTVPGKFVVEVLPAQSAAFTAKFFYRSSGQGLVDASSVVLLPVIMHPLLVLYCTYRYAFADRDWRGGRELRGHCQERVYDVSFIPPATGVLPVVHSTLPAETASRQQ